MECSPGILAPGANSVFSCMSTIDRQERIDMDELTLVTADAAPRRLVKVRAWSVLLLSLLLGAMCVASASATHALGALDIRGRGSVYDGFPLWKDVPGHSFAVLGEGRLHGTRWAVFASRGYNDKQAAQKPCVTVAKISAQGVYGNSLGCGPLAPVNGRRVPPVHPLQSEATRFASGRVVGESIMGLTFGVQVEKVHLDLRPGPDITRATRLISSGQASKARLQLFRYLALSVGREVCVSGIQGYDASGALVLDADTFECRRQK